MQLIPETAIRHGVQNLYDTGDNIRGGARHLRYVLDRLNGHVRLAMAAYNAGERRVERYRAIPPYPETRDYVRKVMIYYKSFRGNYQTSQAKRCCWPCTTSHCSLSPCPFQPISGMFALPLRSNGCRHKKEGQPRGRPDVVASRSGGHLVNSRPGRSSPQRPSRRSVSG